MNFKRLVKHLPDEYQEVEFVSNNGDCYINTGIIPSIAGMTKISYSVQMNDITSGINQSIGANMNLNFNAPAWTLKFRANGAEITDLDTNWHTVTLEKISGGKKTTLDDIESITTATTDEQYYFTLFALNNIDNIPQHFGKYKLKEVKMWDYGTLVRDMIPSRRKSDDAVGMYDIVTNTFYTAISVGGSLTAGNDVNTWVDSHYIMGTDTDTITSLPAVIYPNASSITVGIKGQSSQSGAPSPSSPVSVDGVGELETSGEHAGQFKIPISMGGTTNNMYLGEVQTTRYIAKTVLTSNTNVDWRKSSTRSYSWYFTPSAISAKSNTPFICSHGATVTTASDYVYGTVYCDNTINLGIFPDNLTTGSEVRSWLDEQYAAGTPVVIWTVYTSPTTTITNEPLMKIGTYADSLTTSVSCTAGSNSFDVDTTVAPSEVTATFEGWHPVQSVHEAEHGNNLFDYTTMATSEENSYLMPDGSIGDSNDWNISDYIPCDGTSFAIGYIGGNTPAICLYDENKQYITGKSYNTGGASSKNAVTIASQNTAKYIRFSYCKASGASYDDLSAIMLNKGNSLLPYEPYGTHWD